MGHLLRKSKEPQVLTVSPKTIMTPYVQSSKSLMGLPASVTKFQAQRAGWSRISEDAYHQFVML
jgi:hypothetical protein